MTFTDASTNQMVELSAQMQANNSKEVCAKKLWFTKKFFDAYQLGMERGGKMTGRVGYG